MLSLSFRFPGALGTTYFLSSSERTISPALANCSALADGVNAAAEAQGVPVRAARFGGVFTLFCSPEPVVDLASAQRCDTKLYARIFHGLYDRGIYIAPSQFECNFVSAAHTSGDAEAFVAAFIDTLRHL